MDSLGIPQDDPIEDQTKVVVSVPVSKDSPAVLPVTKSDDDDEAGVDVVSACWTPPAAELKGYAILCHGPSSFTSLLTDVLVLHLDNLARERGLVLEVHMTAMLARGMLRRCLLPSASLQVVSATATDADSVVQSLFQEAQTAARAPRRQRRILDQSLPLSPVPSYQLDSNPVRAWGSECSRALREAMGPCTRHSWLSRLAAWYIRCVMARQLGDRHHHHQHLYQNTEILVNQLALIRVELWESVILRGLPEQAELRESCYGDTQGSREAMVRIGQGQGRHRLASAKSDGLVCFLLTFLGDLVLAHLGMDEARRLWQLRPRPAPAAWVSVVVTGSDRHLDWHSSWAPHPDTVLAVYHQLQLCQVNSVGQTTSFLQKLLTAVQTVLESK